MKEHLRVTTLIRNLSSGPRLQGKELRSASYEFLVPNRLKNFETLALAITEVDGGYYALLGSPNGASTMRVLLRHKSLYLSGNRASHCIAEKAPTRQKPESRESLLLLLPSVHDRCCASSFGGWKSWKQKRPQPQLTQDLGRMDHLL